MDLLRTLLTPEKIVEVDESPRPDFQRIEKCATAGFNAFLEVFKREFPECDIREHRQHVEKELRMAIKSCLRRKSLGVK